MPRFFLFLLFSLSFSASVCSQQFIYTDRQINYDENREQVKIIAASDGFLHVWKYGLSGVSVSIYTLDLKYLTTKKLSNRYKNVTFIRQAAFYYAFLSDTSRTEIYAVKKDGTYTEKTKIIQIQKLTWGIHHSYFVEQAGSILFLIQQVNDVDQQKTFLHITALDSNLTYINKIALEVAYINGQSQRIRLFPRDNQLLLLNNTISNNSVALAVTKIDVVNGVFFTKFFHPEGLLFVSHQLLFNDDEIILQSQVIETTQSQERPKTFSYFIKMNNELEVKNDLYLNSSQLGHLQNASYFYRPALTVVLPGKQLLTIDHGRKESKKLTGPDEVLRFLWMDSSFTILKTINQPAEEEGKYFPTFLLANGKTLHFYYEEAINNKARIINTYELKDSLVNDKPLLLIPAYRYMLRMAIPVSESALVIPYTHNFRLGLVKVNVDQD